MLRSELEFLQRVMFCKYTELNLIRRDIEECRAGQEDLTEYRMEVVCYPCTGNVHE